MSSGYNLPLLSELSGLLSNSANPRKYLAVGAMLSKAEREVIQGSSSKVYLDDAEKDQYIAALAQTLSSNDIDDVIEKSAKEAQDNANKVYIAFLKATVGLIFVDQRYNTQFAIRMKPILRVCHLTWCCSI